MDPILPEPMRETGNTLPAEGKQILSPETAPNTQAEQPHETPPATTLPPLPVAAPISPVPTPVASQSQLQPQDPAQATGAPLIADDVDVIEKEWVDKAKKIVSSTKEDPHVQEKEVSKLQADYLMKRYNKK